jgi:U3 small nucleolar RNA-associated protein 11
MSSTTFKNLIQRREHKERSQPEHRAKYGLLEKHKDYVQRAKNYHSKEKRILALKRRASMRNPDEFYFGMHSTKTVGGVHVKAREDVPQLSGEELALLKTQDRAYVQTIISGERKVRRLAAAKTTVEAGGSARAVCLCARASTQLTDQLPTHSPLTLAEDRAP